MNVIVASHQLVLLCEPADLEMAGSAPTDVSF